MGQRLATGVVAAVVAGLMGLAATSRPAPGAEGSILLSLFEARYRALTHGSASATGSAEQVQAADRLRRALWAELARRDALVEALRSQVLEGPADARSRALAQLEAGVAERERVLMRYLQRLYAMAGDPCGWVEALAPEPPFSPRGPSKGQPDDRPKIRLDFRPEDLERTQME
ncbi:MAG: hypothetical protein Kow0092_06790 [Deferrisomatales bacterium]